VTPVSGIPVSGVPVSGAPPSGVVQVPVLVSQAPVVQSPSTVQVVLHVVASAQISDPGHGVAAPGTHAVVVPEQ
jgi:hypothetical protein